MVGTPLMIVKDRDRQFSLRFFSPPLIFNCYEGMPKPLYYYYIVEATEGFFDYTFIEHERRLGLSSPVFLTVAGGPC